MGMVNGVGLVLEGGGMRGIYTSGVLEYFLENDIEFPYVIGVSAGACSAASYLSKQFGRNLRLNTHYLKDPRYLSWRNYIKKREVFGMDFIFDEIPKNLDPFNFDAFRDNKSQFLVGTTDCYTGQPVYWSKDEIEDDLLTIVRASSSLPFFAPVVEFRGKHLLDGGISDPIPIKKAEFDGYRKNVVVLTRNEGYRKKESKSYKLVKRKYPQYSGLVDAIMKRHEIYNETLDYLEEQEKKGNVCMIRPTNKLKVGRMEKNRKKLEELYQEGYDDAKKVLSFIGKK